LQIPNSSWWSFFDPAFSVGRKFESVSGQDHAQVMRRWVVAETEVEAVDETVDVVLAGADDEE